MDGLRLRTKDLPPARRLEIFREIYGKQILRLEIEPHTTRFDIDVVLQSPPGLGIASGAFSPMGCRLTKELIDNDDLILVIFNQGAATTWQYGRQASVKRGQAILISNDAPATLTAHLAVNVTNLRFSRRRLFQKTVRAEEMIARQVDNQALRLLTSYLDVTGGLTANGPPLLQTAVVDHIHELAALALGATRDVAERAKHGSVRAARLAAIKAYVMANATRPGLSIKTLAAIHSVSERYIRSLFQSEETTFSDFILNERLTQVHTRLTDLRFVGRSISSLAFEAGFGDLSYFNNRFRRKYAATPSDVREAARLGDER
jgi:AraC-like DNA-binding protein